MNTPTQALAATLILGLASPGTAQEADGSPARAGRAEKAQRDDAAVPPGRLDELTDTGDVGLTSDGDVVVDLGRIEGRIVSVDEREATLELRGRPGSRATVPLEKVPNSALFEHVARTVDMDDASSVRALADRAARYELHFHEAEVLGRLAELRPEQADALADERRAAIADGARSRLERARTLRSAGEYTRAMRAFADAAACGDVPAAREARSVLERLEADETAREQAREERDRRRADETLEPIYALQDEAEQALTEARRNLEDLEDVTELLEGAEDTLDEALAKLDELAGEQPTEVQSGLRTSLEDTLVDVHVEAGYAYASLGDAQSARRHAGLASALDANASSVRSLRGALASRDAFDTLPGGR